MPATNIYTVWLAKQSAKGTPASAPVWGTNVRSSDLGPQATRGRIEETGQGRDVGDFETTLLAASGTIEIYMRPKVAGYIFYGALGAKAVTGSADPYTHTFTPADDQPYFTIWHDWGHAKYERFDDCKITGFTLTAQNGQSLRLSFPVMGLHFGRLASIPAGGVLDESPLVRYPGSVIETGGVENPAVQEYTYTLAANQNLQQTVEIYNSYVEPGTRTLGLNGIEVYEDRDLYDSVYYGAPGGTTPSQTVFERTFNAVHLDSDNVERLTVDVPRHAIETAPLPPSTAAEIARYNITGGAQRPSGADITSIDLVNAVASY